MVVVKKTDRMLANTIRAVGMPDETVDVWDNSTRKHVREHGP